MAPLKERRAPVTRQERINQFALPSWEEMSGIFKYTMYNNNHEQYTLYLKHRGVIREFYEAMYDMATGKGTKKRNEFTKNYTQDPESEKYNPDLIDRLSPHLRLVRDKLIKPVKRK